VTALTTIQYKHLRQQGVLVNISPNIKYSDELGKHERDKIKKTAKFDKSHNITIATRSAKNPPAARIIDTGANV
jgi:hypothetical protein